jgi:general secretion pathway protein G
VEEPEKHRMDQGETVTDDPPPISALSWAEEVVPFQGRRREWRCLGITLFELVIIVAIVSTLSAIGLPIYNNYRDNANIVQATADIRAIEHDIYIYEGYATKLPDDLSQVGKDVLLDPWGNPYQYYNAQTGKGRGHQRFDKLAKPLNTDFDLYSMGKDGMSKPNLDNKESLDDIVRALNGEYVGLASDF